MRLLHMLIDLTSRPTSFMPIFGRTSLHKAAIMLELHTMIMNCTTGKALAMLTTPEWVALPMPVVSSFVWEPVLAALALLAVRRVHRVHD